MSQSHIKTKEVKTLFAHSGNQCAYPKCKQRLVEPATKHDGAAVIGKIAHIIADSHDGPRGRVAISDDDKNLHPNLVLLCGNHHDLVDAQPNTFSVQVLRQMKADHELNVQRALFADDGPEKPMLTNEVIHSSILPVTHLPDAMFSAPCKFSDQEYDHVFDRIVYRCDLKMDERIIEPITRQEYREVLGIRGARDRFEVFLAMLDRKLEILSQRDHPLDYVVLVLPDDLYQRCRVANYTEKGAGKTHRDLRRAFKAVAMKYKVATQILRESTTGLTDSKRKMDHPSVIAWNLFNGLYFKVDGLPWAPTELAPASCFIGVSFFRPLGSVSSLRTSVVQAFDENGDGLVLRGHRFDWDENRDGKTPHLPEHMVEELISMVLDRYEQERGQRPQRVVVHKSSRFDPEERCGFEDALKGVSRHDLVALSPTSNHRLLRTGQYPALRGTAFNIGDVSYCYTSGFLSYLDRYSYNELFDLVGLPTASNSKLVEFLEWIVHPLVRVDQQQKEMVFMINKQLKADGFELKPVDQLSGHPVYRMASSLSGVAGTARNLIFASTGLKPEIVFRDAINNDIKLVKNEEFCLVYDRPIMENGLLWCDLVEWWADRESTEPDVECERTLYSRLNKSLTNSPPERILFRSYFESLKTMYGERLPALIPQVYLHYDPFTLAQRGHRKVMPRQRMDFLLLLSPYQRIVIEVDGKQHYSEDNMPSPKLYAEMVAADRELKLAGYEVFRFGGVELDEENGPGLVAKFFKMLFEKHGFNRYPT